MDKFIFRLLPAIVIVFMIISYVSNEKVLAMTNSEILADNIKPFQSRGNLCLSFFENISNIKGQDLDTIKSYNNIEHIFDVYFPAWFSSIIAMPKDVKRIVLRIYDNTEPEKEDKNILYSSMAIKPELTKIISDDFLLPPISVKVVIKAFSSLDISDCNSQIISIEKDYRIELGNNHISLDLGDYELKLSANPETISGTSTGKTSVITANLALVIPSDNFSKPISGKTITFTITSGGGTLDSYSKITDAKGNCSVILTPGKENMIKIKADFQADIDDPNTVYSSNCLVTIEK